MNMYLPTTGAVTIVTKQRQKRIPTVFFMAQKSERINIEVRYLMGGCGVCFKFGDSK